MSLELNGAELIYTIGALEGELERTKKGYEEAEKRGWPLEATKFAIAIYEDALKKIKAEEAEHRKRIHG